MKTISLPGAGAICAAALAVAFAGDGEAQNNRDYDFSPITRSIQQWVDKGYYPGAGLLVVKDNQVIYDRSFGHFTPHTVTLIASSGKWLAAATIMSLVDDRTLSLDDAAAKWLPELKNDPKGAATIRQMLSHTSGYRPYQPDDKPPDKYQTLAESVEHIVPLPPVYRPGERFDYGGLAMQVAGRMAEAASGKEWETLFQERIARPLGMTNTHFTPVDQGSGHSPMLGGGARSTLHDYANFLAMIAGKGLFQGRRVLSKKAVAEMQADQVRGATVKHDEFVERVRGRTHNGVYGLGECARAIGPTGPGRARKQPELGWRLSLDRQNDRRLWSLYRPCRRGKGRQGSFFRLLLQPGAGNHGPRSARTSR